jgi:hypothetical protein
MEQWDSVKPPPKRKFHTNFIAVNKIIIVLIAVNGIDYHFHSFVTVNGITLMARPYPTIMVRKHRF